MSSALRDDLLASALALAALGIRVLPVHTVDDDGHCSCSKRQCKDAGKHPATGHGLTEATTDEATIRGWWASNPWNVAAVPGPAYAVLDFDPWKEDEAKRLARLGDLPPTLTIASGAHEVDGKVVRGVHRWYAVPNGIKVPRKVGGVDVRSDGAYVLVPPSRHQSGVQYEIVEGAFDAISAAPSFITDESQAARQQPPSAPGSGSLTGVPLGRRTLRAIDRGYLPEPEDDEMHRHVAVGIARNLREAGTPREIVDDVMHRLLLDPRSSLGERPWTTQDARTMVASVFAGHAPDHAQHTKRGKRLQLKGLSDAFEIAEQEMDWVVPGLIAAGEKVIIAGPPKSLKTWFALHLALCVACAEAVLGEVAWRPDEQAVLIVEEEGAPQHWGRRLKQVFSDHPSAPLSYVHRGGFSLIGRNGKDSPDVDWLIEEIRRTGTRLVVIDPWQRVTPGVKENDATETGPAWDAIHRIARDTGAGVVVIHHASKGDAKLSQDVIRGSSRMAGEVDLMMLLRKHENGRLEMFLDGRDLARADEGGNLEIEYDRKRPHLMRSLGVKLTFKHETRKARDAVADLLQRATERMSSTEVRQAVNDSMPSTVTGETVRLALEDLAQHGLVDKEAGGPGRSTYWRWTGND